jgi:Zn-dependent peptidase ImmA (M78 family)
LFSTLVNLANELGIDVEFWDFEPPLDAVYWSIPGMPPVIGIAEHLLNKPRLLNCIMAEELGHHYTTTGDALPKTHFHYANKLKISRAEYRALRWAAQYLIPLEKLDECNFNRIFTVWDLADYFDVTEEFMTFRLGLPDMPMVMEWR